jgi:hypothetical protein
MLLATQQLLRENTIKRRSSLAEREREREKERERDKEREREERKREKKTYAEGEKEKEREKERGGTMQPKCKGSITLAFWKCSLGVRFTVACVFNVIFSVKK